LIWKLARLTTVARMPTIANRAGWRDPDTVQRPDPFPRPGCRSRARRV